MALVLDSAPTSGLISGGCLCGRIEDLEVNENIFGLHDEVFDVGIISGFM